MKLRYSITVLVLLLLSAFLIHPARAENQGIRWRSWTDEIFSQAQREKRLIILDLEAVWCHWCHVMEEKTYSHPAVQKIINENFIAVRVDQDARPDLSRRYQEYGWPATIILNAEGQDIVKRAGFIEPENMIKLLNAVLRDPTPEKEDSIESVRQFSSNAFLSPKVQSALESRFIDTHDFKLGGLKQAQKFMDRDTVEYAMMLAKRGNKQAIAVARQNLDAALKLIDPVWGGVYQYSTGGNWNTPHFEKIMSIQADYLRIYSLAYAQFRDQRYLKAAKSIQNYVADFLTAPNGSFYTSQDADVFKGKHSAVYYKQDDRTRRKIGIPKVDKHRYARENGWMIQALATFYTATGDKSTLRSALRSVQWVMANRSLSEGGFRHDEKDTAGPYLGDTLAMAGGFLALYVATAERKWLQRAQASLNFINQNFKNLNEPGFLSAVKVGLLNPIKHIEENIILTRLANLVFHYTGNAVYRSMAEHAMRYLVTPDIALYRSTEAGILIAGIELAGDPTHITIVGSKEDNAAENLYLAAIAYPAIYRRIEWWDKKEGSLPNPDVQYPELEKAAAFICSDKRCSLPIFNSSEIGQTVEKLIK